MLSSVVSRVLLPTAASLLPAARAVAAPAAAALRRGFAGQGGLADEDLRNPAAPKDSPYRDQPRHVPQGEDVGTEKGVKWGQNIPASAEQAKEEIKYAAEGLAGSVSAGVSAMINKGKDHVAGAKRRMGMETPERPAQSEEHMGAAGKMQHAPPGATEGGPVGNARAKYDEIKETMAPAFPEGERSVTEQWRSAGSYQNSPEAAKLAPTPEEQHRANEEIRSEMEGGRRGSGGGAPEMDEALDTGTGLEENLHKRGP